MSPEGPGTQGLPRDLSLVALGSLFLVLLLSWPAVLHPRELVLSASHNDFYGIAWGLDLVAGSIFSGRALSFTVQEILWPEGMRLVVADLPEALLLAPVTQAFGPNLAYNLLTALHHVLSACAAFAAARLLGLGRVPSLIPGFAFAFSPVVLSLHYNGNADVTAWYLLPLVLALAATARGPRGAALAGILAGLVAWCNPYGGLMAALALLVMLPLRPLPRWLAGVVPMILGVGSAAGLLLFVSGGAASAGARLDAPPPSGSSSSLLSLLWPQREIAEVLPGSFSLLHPSYLGISLLCLGIAGLVLDRRLRLAILFGAALLLAMGPELRLPLGITLPSPVALLHSLPGYAELRHPHRLTALAALVLSLGAASLLTGRSGRRTWMPWLALLVCAADLLLLAQGSSRLRPSTPWRDTSCALLASLPAGPILDLPTGTRELWLYGACCHGRPVAEGLDQDAAPEILEILRDPGPRDLVRSLKKYGFRYVVGHGGVSLPGTTALPLWRQRFEACVIVSEGEVWIADLDACRAE